VLNRCGDSSVPFRAGNTEFFGHEAEDILHATNMFADLVDESGLVFGELANVGNELVFRELFGRLVELVDLPLGAKREEGVELGKVKPGGVEKLVAMVVSGGGEAGHYTQSICPLSDKQIKTEQILYNENR